MPRLRGNLFLVHGSGDGNVRGPDVSFISAARLAPDQIPDQFIAVAPDRRRAPAHQIRADT